MPSGLAPLGGAELAARFAALDAFLVEHPSLWRPRPFQHRRLPWESDHPELAAWLRARTLEQAEQAHNAPHELPAPEPFPALARQSLALATVGRFPESPVSSPSARLLYDIPGRKLEQIRTFASALIPAEHSGPWLDWCAGKGHLGRWLAQDGAALTCLEHDPALCEAGARLSARQQLNAEHPCQDVMAEDVGRHFRPSSRVVALHACGDLHRQLLRRFSDSPASQLALAPCCYNRTQAEHYRPLSGAAQRSSLQLSRDDLALPLSETVTAPARVRRQRDQSMARRLAFDLLQREVRGVDEYLPTPSLPTSWLDRPFADYCRHLAELKGLSITLEPDWCSLEKAGWQRLAEVRNIELLRNLFRRPLELWLVLDAALFLQEQGLEVQLGEFCDGKLTPRNLMLQACRICG